MELWDRGKGYVKIMTPGPVMSGLLGWTLGNLVQGHAELSFPAMRWAIGYAWHEA